MAVQLLYGKYDQKDNEPPWPFYKAICNNKVDEYKKGMSPGRGFAGMIKNADKMIGGGYKSKQGEDEKDYFFDFVFH